MGLMDGKSEVGTRERKLQYKMTENKLMWFEK
jgi:hypothetical protein